MRDIPSPRVPQKLSKSGSDLPWAFRIRPQGSRFLVEFMTPFCREWELAVSKGDEKGALEAKAYYERLLT